MKNNQGCKYIIFLRVIFCILFAISKLAYSKNYCIRPDYRARKEYVHCDKTAESSKECQKEVYYLAKKIMEKYGYKRILDLGCGSGYKLVTYFGDFETIGFEIEPTLSWLKEKYPNKRWELSDFAKPFEEPVDLVICSDVIEHVLDPDKLLRWISLVDCKVIVFSTPDRTILVKNHRGREKGPPRNKFHIREWNYKEFERYIGKWFTIIEHIHMKKENMCQVVVCSNS